MRPEHLSPVASGEGDLQGTVSEVEYLGADAIAFATLPGGAEVAVWVVGRSDLHLFDAEGLALRAV